MPERCCARGELHAEATDHDAPRRYRGVRDTVARQLSVAWSISMAIEKIKRVTEDLKLMWYDTQNIHLCTVKDFYNLINTMNFLILEKRGIDRRKKIIERFNYSLLNIFASHVVFLIGKK